MHHLHEEKSASSLGSEIRGIYKQSTTLQKAEYMAMRGGVEVGVGGAGQILLTGRGWSSSLDTELWKQDTVRFYWDILAFWSFTARSHCHEWNSRSHSRQSSA